MITRLKTALTALRNWPWFETLKTLKERFKEDRLGMTAGSLTFTTLIALVPLVTVMLAAFTAFPMFGKFQDGLQKYPVQSLVPDGIAKPVLGALTSFASKANRLGTAGLLMLLASALSLMLTIDRALNGIWRVRKHRPLAQRILVYWGALTLGPVVVGVSVSFTSYALTASTGVVSALPGGLNLALNAVEFSMLALGMACLFHFVPNTHVRWRHAWLGGLVVSLGFELAKRGLAFYISSASGYSTIYGAFATAPIFLLWLYMGWVIVLLGAVIAAYAPSLQLGISRRSLWPGYRFVLALELLRCLREARSSPQRGADLNGLAQSLRVDPLQIEPILETLVEHDWVARLDESGAQRHVLLCDPAQTPARALIDTLLLYPDESVAAFGRRAGFDQMSLADLLAENTGGGAEEGVEPLRPRPL